MKITEKKIEFNFNDAIWSNLIKYDKEIDYLKIEKLNSTKGVDIIGVYKNSRLVFFEVKDFRGHRIHNKTRLLTGELEEEVALKVRDSLAGIIGGVRNSTHKKLLFQNYISILSDSKKTVHIILWMEEDNLSKKMSLKRMKSKRSTTIQMLKNKLKWLSSKVWVNNHRNNNYSDSISIKFLAI